MTFQQKRMVVAGLTALIVVAIVARRPLAESSLHRVGVLGSGATRDESRSDDCAQMRIT